MMMPRNLIQSTLGAVLSGLVLSACGGAPEEGLVSSEEVLGTQESAICSGSSVSSLTIAGGSSWGGEFAASGSWSVTYPANAAHLDFYIDGVLRGSAEREGDSNRAGTWNFSYSPVGCGSHTFKVRAYPMTMSSGQGTDWCPTSGPMEKTLNFTQACPTASLSCSRSGDYINCSGSGSGGSGSPYSSFWQYHAYNDMGDNWTSSWMTGTGSRSFYCPFTTLFFPADVLDISYKVKDSSGMESPVATEYSFFCEAGTYFAP